MPGGLTRWRPFEDLDDLRRRMDRMFEELIGEPRERAKGPGWAPAVDVQRAEGKLIVRADVPGFKPEEIKVELEGVKVELEGDTLTVSGEHQESSEDKQRDFVRRERRYGAFRRSIALPQQIDLEAIEAVTRDGVLEVTVALPEKQPAARKVITPKPA